jgi:hypothetical protein
MSNGESVSESSFPTMSSMLSNSTTSQASASRKPTLTGYMTPKSTPTANPTDAVYEGGTAMTKSLSSVGLMVLVAGCMMLL